MFNYDNAKPYIENIREKNRGPWLIMYKSNNLNLSLKNVTKFFYYEFGSQNQNNMKLKEKFVKEVK